MDGLNPTARWAVAAIAAATLLHAGPSSAQGLPYETLESLRPVLVPEDPDNDTLLLQRAAARPARILDGEGNTYFVSDTIHVADDVLLKNAVLRYTLHESLAIRVISKLGPLATATSRGRGLELNNVTIAMADLPSGDKTQVGSIEDSAAVWIANVDGVRLEDVEVAGELKGTGIRIVESTEVDVIRPHVHHMRYFAASAPATEQLVGVWVSGGADVWIHLPRIHNLTGKILATDTDEPFQTDGITVSGVQGLQITEPRISFVGEGIDLTGSEAVVGFSVTDGVITDADSYCYKFANHTRDGDVQRNQAIRCGYAGFVVAGPDAAPPGPSDIRFFD
ncbi:MAG: right-handed parallel beta-helix repeat-containing protein, partial [Proteobacteria bacterium]|nr:right-handed parallel beta-helix repeat-containing protein [Pseudomonadota bacterium]